MIEKGKTIVLVLLVCSSLLQSYLLAYDSTDYESILESEYVETEIVGTQEKQENLVFPQQIVLHENEETHSVLYPDHYFYKLIMQDLQTHSFEGLKVSEKSALLLKQTMNEQTGVEVKFPNVLPLQIVRHAIPLQVGLPNDTEWIRTMWITIGEQPESVKIYLTGNDFADAYEVVTTDLTADQIRKYIGFGEFHSPKYTVSNFGFLYPSESVPVKRIKRKFTSIASDKMENVLFPDPGITRSLPTSDGTEIYSDGKKGLEIDRSELWMSFTDPMAPIENSFSSISDLNTAVQFINLHGGWNGRFELERVEVDTNLSGPRFIFRQYMVSYPYSYPVLDKKDSRFGTITVLLQQDVVTEYERSLIVTEPVESSATEMLLPGGEALKKRIDHLGLLTQIEAVIPAYKPKITSEYIEFVPVWAVCLNDGTMVELP